MTPSFATLEEMILATAQAVRPPERLTVSQAAEKYRYLNNPGSYVGPWRNSKTPYMIEPMDELTSLDFTGMVFAGPARCGKTDCVFNWVAFTAICDPADMMVVQMTQNVARDWSQKDLRKVLRHSSAIGAKVQPGRQSVNVHDVKFMNGMNLLIKWPSITELSGKTIPRLWLADYDRMPMDVDGEGNPFDLARKRAQTFKRYGMCAAEGSPGFPVQDLKWTPSSPHEAPPAEGIMSLYNRGDRRRWMWRCRQCDEPFEADFKHLSWPKTGDSLEAAEAARLICPHCGFPHEEHHKREIHEDYGKSCRWVKEGQVWMPDGSLRGKARRSDIASFWLKGVAAAFADWKDLVYRYIKAMEEYDRTGSEEALKTTINVDQGHPYLPKSMENGRLPETLKERAVDWGGSADDPHVPEGVRFLVASVDVQSRSFVCQVHGFGPGGDVWFIDTFKIRKSDRIDGDGDRQQLDPAAYLEDWETLIPAVIQRSYPLNDGSGRRMMVKMVFCDSGGRDGVTSNAYNFWRRLRDNPGGLHKRFRLVKGEPSKSAPRVRETYPDATNKNRHSGARGDVPVLLINSNTMKDQASNMLGRTDPAGGMVHFPIWMEKFIYSQLTAEIRTEKGWDNPGGKRNEAWDLFYYALAGSLYAPIRIEHINWDTPPTWAADWDDNDLVYHEEAAVKPFEDKPSGPDLASLGAALA